MTKMMFGHDRHALVDCILWRYVDYRAGHDLMDLSLFRGATPEDHFAGIVAFGKDSDELILRHNEQCSYTLYRHFLDGFVNGVVGCQGEDSVVRLALKQHFYRVSTLHGAASLVEKIRCKLEPVVLTKKYCVPKSQAGSRHTT